MTHQVALAKRPKLPGNGAAGAGQPGGDAGGNNVHHGGKRRAAGLLIGLPALLEAKHAATAVYEQFAACHTFWDVVTRFVQLDEPTFGGVILLVMVVVGMTEEHAPSPLQLAKKLMRVCKSLGKRDHNNKQD